jgi:A/G-specific adenine glycosylase
MNRWVPSRDKAIGAALLSWYRSEKRRLPWRGTHDPYRIWVSEVMLQQTTVAAVRARYEDFVHRFPTLLALARSSEDDVLAAWSGLGYYGRARNLLRAAQEIARKHDGELPREPAQLAQLPGFGPYTAAAVACLAFGVRVPAAEANVTRVVSRLFLLRGRTGTRAHAAAVLERAAGLLPRDRPGNMLAALMDLGQTLCLPRAPLCESCPIQERCLGSLEGNPEAYPSRSPRRRAVSAHMACAVARDGRRTLLLRQRSSLLDNLWQFPSGEGPTAEIARTRLRQSLVPLGLRVRPGVAAVTRHTMVNRRLTIEIFVAEPARRRASPACRGKRWFRPHDLERAAIPTLTRKVARAVGLFRAGPAPKGRDAAAVLRYPRGSGSRHSAGRAGLAAGPDISAGLANIAQERHGLPASRAAAHFRRAHRLYDDGGQDVLPLGR